MEKPEVDHQLEIDLLLGCDPEVACHVAHMRALLKCQQESIQTCLDLLESLKTRRPDLDLSDLGRQVERDREMSMRVNDPLPKED